MSIENSFLTNDEVLDVILNDSMQGWWSLSITTSDVTLTPSVAKTLGLPPEGLNTATLLAAFRSDHRARIRSLILSNEIKLGYEEEVQLEAQHSNQWVRLSVLERNEDNTYGIIQVIAKEDTPPKQKDTWSKTNNLLEQFVALSSTMANLVTAKDKGAVINKILDELIETFNADRSYIFIYNEEKKQLDCTHLRKHKGLKEEISNVCNPLQDNAWWREQTMAGDPIILSSIDELPQEIRQGKNKKIYEQIKSLFIAPLKRDEATIGFVGMDMIRTAHQWTDGEKVWLAKLFETLGVCIELRESDYNIINRRNDLEHLFTNLPIGYFSASPIFDDDDDIIDCMLDYTNDEASRLMGFSKANIGEYGSTFLAPEQYRNYMESLQSVYYKRHKYVKTMYNEQGMCFKMTLYPTADARVACLIADLTEETRINSALEDQESFKHNLFDNLPIGVELYDNEGSLVEINRYDMELFGIKEKESVLGINLFENPNVNDYIKQKLLSDYWHSSMIECSFEILGSYYNSEQREGTMSIYNSVSALCNDEGEINNFLMINVDETQLSELYGQVTEFERTLGIVCNHCKIGYCHYDVEDESGFALPQWRKNLGEERSAELPTIFGQFTHIHDDDRPSLIEQYESLRRGDLTHFTQVVRLATTAEAAQWIKINMMLVADSSGASSTRLMSLTYDITPQKAIEKMLIQAREKAETSDQLKSAFLANMSHEIRTPLNAIVGFSQLLADCDEMDERAEYLQIINENSALLIQLISDILDLSKIESGALDFVYSKVNPAQLCREVVQSVIASREMIVELRCDAPERRITIDADINRLKQVLINFITNSLKFTHQGHVNLSYEMIDAGHIKFIVEDTGAGIPKEKLGSIFNRFTKLNHKVQGTGLGLSICRNIADQMGGELGVASELGRGTTAWFILPTNNPNAAGPQQDSEI